MTTRERLDRLEAAIAALVQEEARFKPVLLAAHPALAEIVSEIAAHETTSHTRPYVLPTSRQTFGRTK